MCSNLWASGWWHTGRTYFDRYTYWVENAFYKRGTIRTLSCDRLTHQPNPPFFCSDRELSIDLTTTTTDSGLFRRLYRFVSAADRRNRFLGAEDWFICLPSMQGPSFQSLSTLPVYGCTIIIIISTNFQPKQLNPSALYHELCTQQTKDQTPSNSNILSQSSRLVSSSSLLSNYELPKLQFGRKFSLVVRKSEIPKEHAYATKINQSQSPSQ